jgi:hypothetical protein
MSRLLLLQLPSVPMPTLTPASIMACSGAIPHASLLLDTGQEATLQRAACRVCHDAAAANNRHTSHAAPS